MRYIDVGGTALPAGWLKRAGNASAAVAKGDSVESHGAVWRALKDALGTLFYDKCWFCEVPISRSDNAVDHFRPKARCGDAAAPHSGYVWLAFDHTNYRYSCTYCNSKRNGVGTKGGKGDRFPLVDESKRLYAPGSLHCEEPLLLDPCELADWELLGCRQEDGYPCCTTADSNDIKRVEASICIYHLNHEPTCRMRHTQAVRLLSEVSQAKDFFTKSSAGDVAARKEFKEVARRIKRSIDRNSPFSGEMIFLLRGERSAGHPWVQQLLDA